METNNHWEKKIINIYNDLNNFKKTQHQELFQNSFSLLQEADAVSAELNHILNNSKNNTDLKNNLLKVISNIKDRKKIPKKSMFISPPKKVFCRSYNLVYRCRAAIQWL